MFTFTFEGYVSAGKLIYWFVVILTLKACFNSRPKFKKIFKFKVYY